MPPSPDPRLYLSIALLSEMRSLQAIKSLASSTLEDQSYCLHRQQFYSHVVKLFIKKVKFL